MSGSQVFDVIITGAGPAGSTCALALSRKGLRVALLDRAVFPREKICGGALAEYVPDALGKIHPDFKKAFLEFKEIIPANNARVFAPAGHYYDLTRKAFGSISTRMDFDNFLFRLAKKQEGIFTFENTEVIDVEITPGHVMATSKDGRRFEAKIIIGCDGAHSVVSKKLTNNKVDRDHYCAGIRAYYESVSGVPQNTFEVFFLDELIPGYFWIFPIPGGKVNVGSGVLSSVASKRKINLRKLTEDLIKSHRLLKDRFKNAKLIGEFEGFGLPLNSKKIPRSGNRFMLCGDAASFIDPLTGEGIAEAMVSGRSAGWVAEEAIKQNDLSAKFLYRYDEQMEAKFRNSHKWRYIVIRLASGRAWFINFGVKHASKFRTLYSLIRKIGSH